MRSIIQLMVNNGLMTFLMKILQNIFIEKLPYGGPTAAEAAANPKKLGGEGRRPQWPPALAGRESGKLDKGGSMLSKYLMKGTPPSSGRY